MSTVAGAQLRNWHQPRKAYPILVGTGLGILGLNVLAPGALTPVERALGSGMLVLAALPAWRFVRRRESGLPFLPLLGAVYAVHYALPVFLLPSFGFKGWLFSHRVLEQALLLAALGLASLLVAFYGMPGISGGGLLPRLRVVWEPARVRLAAPPIAFFGLILTYVRQTVEIPLVLQQVVDFLSMFSLLAILTLYILQLQGRLDRSRKLLLWGVLLPGQLVMDLATGAVYQVMKDLLPLILIHWGMRRRLPWEACLIGLLVLVLLRGNQAAFRWMLRTGAAQSMSIPEKSRLYVDLVLSSVKSGQIGNAYALTVERTSHLTTLADVVEQTPAEVPYWRGESYSTLLTSPVPRLLWPDKPTKTLGQTFGHRYGRLAPDDDTTSENLPQLVEMYANFGRLGVVVGMFVVGAVYRAVHRMINHARAGEGGLLISAMIFSNLLCIESDASLVFGAVLQHIVLLYLLLKPLQARRRLARAAGGAGFLHARHDLCHRPVSRL